MMHRHLGLALARLLLAGVVAVALPFSHVHWGETYPGDGQQGFGFVLVFTFIGFTAAALYLLLGSWCQFAWRQRPAARTLLVDAGLFVVLVGLLVYGGITAHYSDASAAPAREEAAAGR